MMMQGTWMLTGVLLFAGLTGCGAKPEPAADSETLSSEDARPVAAAESSARSGELLGREYVPPDALFVSVLSPQRILSRPELVDGPVGDVLKKADPIFIDEMLVPGRFLDALGVPLQDVAQVICVVDGIRKPYRTHPRTPRGAPVGEAVGETNAIVGDEATVTAESEGDGLVIVQEANWWLYGSWIDAYVVRFTGEAPREAAVDLLFRPKQLTFAGKTYYGQGEDTGAFALHFPDERTMIVGEERVVRRMIVERASPSALTQALEDLGPEPDFRAVVRVPEAIGQMAAASGDLHSSTGEHPALKTLRDDATIATLCLRLDPRPSAKLALPGNNAESGARLDELMRNLIGAARAMVPPAGAQPDSARPSPDEAGTPTLDLLTRAIGGLKVEYQNERVEITLSDFADLTDLVALLKQATAAANGALAQPAVLPPEDNPAAATIRRLLPTAAGFPATDMARIAISPATPRASDLEDKALSVMAMTYKVYCPDLYEAHEEEFQFDMIATPQASDLAQELSRNRYLGCVSMIHADRITDFACEVDGDTAKGSLSFKVPGLYRGKVQYVAEQVDGRWQIKEFHLPIHRWKFVRTEAGLWKCFDFYGDVTDMTRWPVQPVAGKVTLDGKPLTGSIMFYHTVDHDVPGTYGDIGADGEYHTELVPGSYRVVIRMSEPEVPEKYRTPGGSGLMIEVKEGENTFDFDLAPE